MRSALAVVCLLLAACAAFAQSDRGAITGTVSDPAGGVISGASIEAKNTETAAQYQTSSTATGNYTLAQLPAGQYELTISFSGFKQYVRKPITVLVAQTLRIDATLEVGALTESVTVSADAPLLKTESGELSHNISSDRLNSLPVLGFVSTIRDPFYATQLIPGTLFQNRNWVRVNGAPANSQTLRVEGQDATNSLNLASTGMSQPSVEAMEEMSIQTSNYAAEFGQAGGGLFNATMKSGSNSFHGTLYDYWANEALNAATPFVNSKARIRRNDYGFTISGPVILPKLYDGHNKTFFFFNWEQFREQQVINNVVNTVPTVAYRNGDFRQNLTTRQLGIDPLNRPIIEGTIYDPATDRLAPNGQRVRDPFNNNTIPQDRWDPVAAKINALIPLPTNSNINSNYGPTWVAPNIRNIPAVKVDHNLSTNSKLAFYWSTTSQEALRTVGPPGGDGLPLPITTARGTHIHAYTIRLNFDHTLSPTQVLHLGAGLQRIRFNDDVEENNYDQLKELGLPGSNLSVFPYITGLLPTGGRGGMKDMGPSTQSTEYMYKPTGNASFTWVKNNHTYKFGAEVRLEGYPNALGRYANGNYTFSAAETALPYLNSTSVGGGTIGFGYASFLLGRVNAENIGVVNNIRVGKSAWAVFAQDSWKITRTLTLDYGLRWDYQGYFREQYGRAASFSPTTPNPSAGGLLGAVIYEKDGPGHCNCNFANVYPYAFGPRLGIAYQIDPKTVIRAGGGISYSQTSFENQISQTFGSQNPYPTSSFGDPVRLLSQGAPTPAPWPSTNPGLYPFTGTTQAPPVAIDRNAGRPARQIMWSIGVQREIFQNLAIEASYVGNRGAWWQGNNLIDVNALTAQRIASFGLDVTNPSDQKLLITPWNKLTAAQQAQWPIPYATFPQTQTLAQVLRPFPQFGGITGSSTPGIQYIWAPLGRTWYDSLQLKATKRFSHGLDFTSVFTWQKELTMGVGTEGGAPAVVNDVFNRAANKYVSPLSRPFVWVTAANYTVPRVNTNKFLSYAIRDWTIGTMLQYASGMPILAPVAQQNLSSYLFRNTYANRVAGQPLFTQDLNCHCFDPNKTFVLNPQAWADPAPGTFGTGAAYYNDYRQQRVPLENVSLGRNFRIKEGVNISIRADFVNILNRTRLAAPDSTNAKLTQTINQAGQVVTGFGRINTLATLSSNITQRAGNIVARIQF